MSRTITQKGFTLVEMLVYLAVLLLVLAAAISVIVSLRTPLAAYRTDQLLYQTADSVLGRISTEVRNADSVSVPGSTFTTSPGTLALTTDAGERSFTLNSGIVEYSESGVYVGDLNSSKVVADSLIFTHMTGAATEVVRTTLTLTATVGDVVRSETFYSATVLRGSYE